MMTVALVICRTIWRGPEDRGEDGRAALDRRAVQVAIDRPQPALFLSPARPARATVDELRHWGPVPGGFPRTVAVKDKDPAVVRRSPENDVSHDPIVL